jgi:uncharacterized protein (TIGR00369 family)
MVALDAAQIDEFLAAAFPGEPLPMRATRSDEAGVEMVLTTTERSLRPGATISGPTLMTFADTVAYATVVARIGPEPLTVTSHLAIDFLRKAPLGDLRATGELLKVGRRQALIAIRIYSVVTEELVAHATCTYAIPRVPTVPRADLA